MDTKFRLRKYDGNPVLAPNEENPWESLSVCNPGAWYENGRFYLLYRAAGNDIEHYIHFGLAESEDGLHFRRVSKEPALSPGIGNFDSGCIEDPRIVKLDGVFYITYAYRPFPPGQYWKFGPDQVKGYDVPASAPKCLRENIANSGLLMSTDLKSFSRLGRITQSTLDDRDVILFPERVHGRYVLLHRPKEWIGTKYGCDFPSIWISYSEDLLEWKDGELLAKGELSWEKKIGGSAPPIKTDEGWLVLYHGVDDKGIYRVGVMLLDIDNPSVIIARATDYIMEPEHAYETNGFYNGCVFPTGNVVVNGTLYVYYGGADKFVCMASCRMSEILEFVLQYR